MKKKNFSKRNLVVLILCVLQVLLVCCVCVLFKNDKIKMPTFKDFRMEEVFIYDGDSQGESLKVGKVVKIEGGKTTEDKIDIVVDHLEKKFPGIELEVVGYENIGTKKVLVLDLKDKDRPIDEYINAGSTGSRICLGIIVNSLLQNEKNMSNWIDGVKILVNGEAGVETEHVDLNDIFYKSRDRKIELQ